MSVIPFPSRHSAPRADAELLAVDLWRLDNGLSRVALRSRDGRRIVLGDYPAAVASDVALGHAEHRDLNVVLWSQAPNEVEASS